MTVPFAMRRLVARSSGAQWRRRAAPAYTRGFASQRSEPPRSQNKPAQAGEMKSWMPIAGIGLGLGACFFYLMSRPHNAPKVAHATGQNLPELSGRETVNAKDGTRMGTQRSG